MKKSGVLATAAAALLLAACADDGDPKRELEQYIEGYASTVCSAMVTCSCTAPAGKEACEVAYRTMLEDQLADELLEYPGQVPNPAAIDTCLRDLRAAVQGCPGPTNDGGGISSVAMSKGGFGVWVPSCDEDLIFVGGQAAGEYCAASRECVPGLACNRTTLACAAPAALDASCEDVECAAGLRCDYTQHCVAPPAAGEPCPDGLCAEGSRCVDVDPAPTCVAPHAAEESCADGAGCVAGTFCDWDTELCTVPLADGEDCSSDHQCAHLWCRSDTSTCDDPGFCDGGRGY